MAARVAPIGLAICLLFVLSTAVRANYNSSKSWFEALPVETRVSIQGDLVLTGFYDAFVDGVFGPSTYDALTDFQRSQGKSETGVLDTLGRAALERAAASVYSEFGFQDVRDSRGHLELLVPRLLLPRTVPTSNGTEYASAGGDLVLRTMRIPADEFSFSAAYAHMSAESSIRDVTYSVLRGGYFVVSGKEAGRYFYSLLIAAGDASVGYTVLWDQTRARQGAIVALVLASYAQPWEPQTAPAPSQQTDPKEKADTPTNTQVVENPQFGNFIVFEEFPGLVGMIGEITPTTPLDFRRLVEETGPPKVLALNSPGGGVSSALLLAYEVHQRGIATYISSESGCYSACSFIFFAGVERAAEGELGVHQIWASDPDLVSAQTTISDILDALNEFEVSDEVVSAMLRTPAEDMYVFSASELERMKIESGDPLSQLMRAPVTEYETSNTTAVTGITPIGEGEALLLESGGGSSGATVFHGTVQWSWEITSDGSRNLVARAEVPSRDFVLLAVLRENSDPYLPASTLVELTFELGERSPDEYVSAVPGILVKDEQLIQGAPLHGATAELYRNRFLYALSSENEDANAQMVRANRWIDIAVIFDGGRRAIITLEKLEDLNEAIVNPSQ